jgi:hypothetical protein
VLKHLGIYLIALLFSSTAWSQVDGKWSEGEHLELGVEGSLIACKSLGIAAEKCPNQRLVRGDKKFTFQYGEIVTSADYYNNPSEFYTDKKSGIARVIKCAHRQKSYHDAQRKSEIAYPSCDTTAVFKMPGYLEVVSQNYSHFGWNNMVAYVEFHGQALLMAKKSYEKSISDPVLSRQLLNRAIIYNGYADHYLTDAFASGHIRVPRIQIKDWASRKLPGALKSARGDLLTMFLHNFESSNLRTRKEEGLRVQNSRGDVWITRGDRNLNLHATKKDPAVLLPRQAVTESFKDILIAAIYGDLPEVLYQATQFVPFQNDIPLIDKLSPGHQKVRRQSDIAGLLFSSVPLSEKFLFFKSDFARVLDNMAGIFIKFRQDVAHEQFEKSELKQRLPEKYLQAYLDVE